MALARTVEERLSPPPYQPTPATLRKLDPALWLADCARQLEGENVQLVWLWDESQHRFYGYEVWQRGEGGRKLATITIE